MTESINQREMNKSEGERQGKTKAMDAVIGWHKCTGGQSQGGSRQWGDSEKG